MSQLKFSFRDPLLEEFKSKIIDADKNRDLIEDILVVFRAEIIGDLKQDITEKEVMIETFYKILEVLNRNKWIFTKENAPNHEVCECFGGVVSGIEAIKKDMSQNMITHCWEYKEKVFRSLTKEIDSLKRLNNELYIEVDNLKNRYKTDTTELRDCVDAVRIQEVIDVLNRLINKFNGSDKSLNIVNDISATDAMELVVEHMQEIKKSKQHYLMSTHHETLDRLDHIRKVLEYVGEE